MARRYTFFRVAEVAFAVLSAALVLGLAAYLSFLAPASLVYTVRGELIEIREYTLWQEDPLRAVGEVGVLSFAPLLGAAAAYAHTTTRKRHLLFGLLGSGVFCFVLSLVFVVESGAILFLPGLLLIAAAVLGFVWHLGEGRLAADDLPAES